jgi:hypothetical protein
MPDIASVLLGAIIGGAFSLIATRLSLRGRTDYFDDMALKHIDQMLRQDKDISMGEMISWGKSIGMAEADSRQLIFIAKSRLGQQVYVDAHKAKAPHTAALDSEATHAAKKKAGPAKE